MAASNGNGENINGNNGGNGVMEASKKAA